MNPIIIIEFDVERQFDMPRWYYLVIDTDKTNPDYDGNPLTWHDSPERFSEDEARDKFVPEDQKDRDINFIQRAKTI